MTGIIVGVGGGLVNALAVCEIARNCFVNSMVWVGIGVNVTDEVEIFVVVAIAIGTFPHPVKIRRSKTKYRIGCRMILDNMLYSSELSN